MILATLQRQMPEAIIIGDGPGGLSCALFLAKNKVDVLVLGEDKTAMHWAQLRNYLGIVEIHGSELQKIGRKQVIDFGGRIRDDHVESIAQSGSTWTVTVGNEKLSASYLVLSEGKAPMLAKQVGLAFDDRHGIATDRNARAPNGVYVVGRSARPGRSQAIISAGDGAAAAIDILSRIKGEDFVDWDEPPKA